MRRNIGDKEEVEIEENENRKKQQINAIRIKVMNRQQKLIEYDILPVCAYLRKNSWTHT